MRTGISSRVNLLTALLLIIVSGSSLQASNYVLQDTITNFWEANVDTLLVRQPVYIANYSSLSISPGTVVLFEGNYPIVVKGRMIADGTSAEPILFTAADTNEGWGGIRYINTPAGNDSSRFVNCIFEYGKTNYNKDKHFRNGGALYIWEFSKVEIDSCIFRYNKASGGSGLFAKSRGLTVSHSTFIYNRNGFAGTIYIKDSPTIKINHCKISHNWGGGISIFDNQEAHIHNTRVTYNVYEHKKHHNLGAGIFTRYTDIHLRNNVIAYNQNRHNEGGGIYYYGSTGDTCRLVNNIIAYNECGKDEHDQGGGGAYLSIYQGNLLAKNNLIGHNKSTGKGGGLFISRNKAVITNNTIVHNHSQMGGGAIGYGRVDFSCKNNILRGNASENGYSEMDGLWGGHHSFSYNNIEGDTSQIGGPAVIDTFHHNIDTAAGFAVPGRSYRLTPKSPCINAGIPDTSGLNLPEKDLLGNTRITGDTVDIGAYEYHPPEGTPVCYSPVGMLHQNEDFGSVRVPLDTVFRYPPGINYLGFRFAAGTDTNTIRASISQDTLLLHSRPERYGKDTLYITAYDGLGGHTGDTIPITIASVNDPPVAHGSDGTTLTEHTYTSPVLDTFTVTDADTGQQYTWHIDTVSVPGILLLNDSTGVLSMTDSLVPNYEETERVVLDAVVTDNGTPPKSDTLRYVLQIKNMNEAPVFINFPDTLEIAEQPPEGTVVDTIVARDTADTAQTFIYSLSGYRAYRELYLTQEGVLRTLDSFSMDYEEDSVFMAIITAEEDGHPNVEVCDTFIIKLLDVPENSGIRIPGFAQQVAVYPNPTSDRLIVKTPKIPGNTTLLLRNTTGKAVYRHQSTDLLRHVIPLKDVPPGTYFLILRQEQRTIFQEKVVVE